MSQYTTQRNAHRNTQRNPSRPPTSANTRTPTPTRTRLYSILRPSTSHSSSNSSNSSSNGNSATLPLTLTPRHQPCIIPTLPIAHSRITSYCLPHSPPPPNWLSRRHRDCPAIFRDSFSHCQWWSEQQQTVIRDLFSGWSTKRHHPLRHLTGYTTNAASTRAWQRQKKGGGYGGFQNHSLDYYINQLHKRSPTARRGHILYNITVPMSDECDFDTDILRTGPAGLHMHKYDLLHKVHFSPLSVIAGMQNTATSWHVDGGAESTWQLLLEGTKLWMVCRPEEWEAVQERFIDEDEPTSMSWWRFSKEEKQWLVEHQCMLIVQHAGDILYLPASWPHAVKHTTDTIALHLPMVQSWDGEQAVRMTDFEQDDLQPHFRRAYEYCVDHAQQLGVSEEDRKAIDDELFFRLAMADMYD